MQSEGVAKCFTQELKDVTSFVGGILDSQPDVLVTAFPTTKMALHVSSILEPYLRTLSLPANSMTNSIDRRFEPLVVLEIMKKFLTFYGTRMPFAVATKVHLVLGLSRSNPVTSSHPVALRSILILSSHLFLCLLSGLFYSDFLAIINIQSVNLSAALYFLVGFLCSRRIIE